MKGQTDFRFGRWQVWPESSSIGRDGVRRHLEPRLMQVLCTLCERAGDVVSCDDLLRLCWGSTVYGDGPVHKAIAQLRRALDDRAHQAHYIQTIRKRGYRTIAPVLPHAGQRVVCGADEWRDGSPFRGLEAFDARHARVFFGRARAEAELRACLHAQAAQGCAMVVLLGPSGSGKTSLVQAGLLPALLHADADAADGIALASAALLDPARPDAGDPWRWLADAMLDWRIGARPVVPAQAAGVLARRLSQSPDLVQAELRWQLDGLLGTRRSGPVLGLFVDRFERLLLAPGLDDDDRRAFVAALEALARGGDVLVILACRNDLYPQLARLEALMAVKGRGGHYDLAPPGPAEIAQMIRLPARAAGLSFGVDRDSQARLDDVLCGAAASSPDALPLLQYALHLLYEARSPANELDFAAYRRIDGIEGAIGYRAETVLAALGEREQACLPQVLALLVSLAEDGSAIAGRKAAWSALRSDAERALVRALVDARLLVSELVAGAAGFGVAHEALLRHWPRATGWIERHRALLRVRARLSALAVRWQDARCSQDLLLPEGRQLDEARQLLAHGGIALSPSESALVVASIARATRRRRRRTAVFAGIGMLALLVGAFGLLAIRADRVAQIRRAQAEALMGYMLGDFADKLRPLGRLDLLEGISAKAFVYLRNDRAERLDATEQRQRAQALQVIAEVWIARGESARADAALDAAHRLLRHRIEQAPDDADALKLLGINAFWQGKIRLDRNDWAQAERRFGEYLEASRRRHALRPDDADAWIEASYALNSLGSLWLKRGELERASDAFAGSVRLKTRALQRRPRDATLQAELADSIAWEATARQKGGQLRDALATYVRGAEMIRRLQGDPPVDAVWRHRLAYALMHSAEIRLALGQRDAAARELRQASQWLEALAAREPDNLEWRRDASYVRLQLEDIPQQAISGDSVANLRLLDARLQALTARDPDNERWLRLRASAGVLLALALGERGDRDRARARIGSALEMLQSVNRRNPDNQNGRQALANAWLASAWIARDDAAASHAACGRAAELLRDAANGSRDYRILAPWLRSQHCLGNDRAQAEAAEILDRIGYREWRRWRAIGTSIDGASIHERAQQLPATNG